MTVKTIVAAGQLNKWVKATAAEISEVEESIREQNLLRNIPPAAAPNYRHYVRDGFICVTEGGDAEQHPSDVKS